MTTDQADWRLLNYDGYGEMLNGKEFELKTFHEKDPNDHEHCILCWQTISSGKRRRYGRVLLLQCADKTIQLDL